jgi:hypothetical protein
MDSSKNISVDGIFQAAKVRHANGKWIDFPNPPGQARVLDWFFKLQSDFFSDRRGIFYTTHNRDLTDSDAKRRLDLLVQLRSPKGPAPAHDWKDVWVIGAIKEGKEGDKPLLVQLAEYAREVFSSQPARRFVHGFTIRVTNMQLWVYDRSGPCSSTEFNIHEQPKRFIQAIASYLMMSDNELGIDTFIERHGKEQFITVVESGSGAERRLQLDPEPIAFQRAVVCRGTSCYRAKRVGVKDWEYVVKLSWRSDKRRAEGELLKLAQERGVEGVAEIFAHNQITSIADLRCGIQFKQPHRFQESNFGSLSSSKSRSLIPNSFKALGINQGSSLQKRKAIGHGKDEPVKRSRSNSNYNFRSNPSPSKMMKNSMPNDRG